MKEPMRYYLVTSDKSYVSIESVEYRELQS